VGSESEFFSGGSDEAAWALAITSSCLRIFDVFLEPFRTPAGAGGGGGEDGSDAAGDRPHTSVREITPKVIDFWAAAPPCCCALMIW
jgi:hypothetical protein